MGLVVTKTIGQELLRLHCPRLLAARAHHHRNKTHTVLLCRRYQTVARRIGVTGLDAIYRLVSKQQFIAVRLSYAVVLKIFLRVVAIVLGVIIDQRSRQDRQVTRGCQVPLNRPAGGILKMAIAHPQQRRLLVHDVGKGSFAASHMLRQSDTGIVTRLDNHAAQQILHRHLGALANKHLRAAHLPGLDANIDEISRFQVAALDLRRDNIAGHHLGQAGRRQLLIGISLHQHRTGIGINQ